ncbi:MAG: SDR family oxidoreductase [Planctomycetes bacterium]|nr:SDR family oxidoreductase [Planctomycetota bacterium]
MNSAELVSLAGRTALVAGGGGGIGSAIVECFAGAGARVVSVDRVGSTQPACARAFECDLGRADDVRALFAELRTSQLLPDLVVHSAGITRDRVLWKLDDQAWSEVLRTNLDSAFYLLRESIPTMRERGFGAVVLISSINGERGKVGQGNYAASKAGLIGLARTAAREAGRFGIRVNVIAPGLVRTPMTEKLPREVLDAALAESALGRASEPADVANTALYLCSALSRQVTGQVLRVDGGQLIA